MLSSILQAYVMNQTFTNYQHALTTLIDRLGTPQYASKPQQEMNDGVGIHVFEVIFS
jgi:hypothetical protein